VFLASVEKWYLKNRILFWVIFACGLQNLMWFSSHYLGVSTFPWDFPLGYHAVNYFLVESLRQGVVPEWVPIQGMGYPMFLNLQSYVFYPLLTVAGHQCQYKLRDGKICGSTYQLQIDHIFPKALGGSDDIHNLRILCRTHNNLMAEKFGLTRK